MGDVYAYFLVWYRIFLDENKTKVDFNEQEYEIMSYFSSECNEIELGIFVEIETTTLFFEDILSDFIVKDWTDIKYLYG